MSFARRVARRQALAFAAMTKVARSSTAPHRLGSSQEEALAHLRELPVPPSADDTVDEINYRRARNAGKRARRAR